MKWYTKLIGLSLLALNLVFMGYLISINMMDVGERIYEQGYTEGFMDGLNLGIDANESLSIPDSDEYEDWKRPAEDNWT